MQNGVPVKITDLRWRYQHKIEQKGCLQMPHKSRKIAPRPEGHCASKNTQQHAKQKIYLRRLMVLSLYRQKWKPSAVCKSSYPNAKTGEPPPHLMMSPLGRRGASPHLNTQDFRQSLAFPHQSIKQTTAHAAVCLKHLKSLLSVR